MKLPFGIKITRDPRATYTVKTLSRVQLADDDILVIHADMTLARADAERLEGHIKSVFGETRRVLIFDKGILMTVVSQERKDADSGE